MLRIKTVVVGDYATNTYLIENTETKECVIVVEVKIRNLSMEVC